MTLKKADLTGIYRLNSPLYNDNRDKAITPQALSGILSKAEAKVGKVGADAIKAAFDQAKTKAGANPTYQQVLSVLDRAKSSLANERANGRINDGYIDGREVAALKSDVATKVYAYLSKVTKAQTPDDLGTKATKAQLNKALGNLNGAIDEAFKGFAKIADGDYNALVKELRKASASMPKSAQSALIIAMNGKVGRGDNGTLDDMPSAADVKTALKNAYTKLLSADGAKVVDFKNPTRAPASKKDGVVTGVEVDRTPAVQGKAAHALLAYASKL